jgi:phage terminase small subunit
MAKKKVTPFDELTPEEQLSVRKEAYKKWALEAYDNPQRLSKIALDLGMSHKQLTYFKLKDKWQERYEKSKGKLLNEKEKEINKVAKKNNKKINTSDIIEVLETAEIPEKWQMYILHYLQNFNATQSARLIGYTGKSNSIAFKILNDDRVQSAIKKIKAIMAVDLHVTAHDILDQYMKIAFADMAEYVEFDARRVKLKNSQDVDGKLIQEVRQGKDGVTIKLVDKKWALERLEKLFDIVPDKRLELDEKKFEYTKQLAEKEVKAGNKVVIINDL